MHAHGQQQQCYSHRKPCQLQSNKVRARPGAARTPEQRKSVNPLNSIQIRCAAMRCLTLPPGALLHPGSGCEYQNLIFASLWLEVNNSGIRGCEASSSCALILPGLLPRRAALSLHGTNPVFSELHSVTVFKVVSVQAAPKGSSGAC